MLGHIPPRVRLALLVLFSALVADVAVAADPTPCPPGGTDRAAVVCELNAARADAGRDPVRARPSLERAATGHAADMVERRYFAHESLGGSSAADRARREGYMRGAERWRIGEILIWTRGTPLTATAAVDAWLASPDHRRILLSGRYDEVGVGIVPGAPSGSPDGQPATTIAVSFGRRSG